MDAHQRRRHRCILGLLQGLEGTVLDYGCGWGDLTWAISRTHPQVQGVDVDPDRVAFAQEQYAPLKFSVCRPDGLDFPKASFDILTSVVVVPFVPDVDAYLADVRRVLKPGGHLVIAGRSQPWLNRTYHRLLGGSSTAARKLHVHAPGALEAVLEHSGFTVVKRAAFYDPPFSDRRHLVDWFNSLVEIIGEGVGAIEPAPYPVFLVRRND
jgi:ubiquinone/menaquinone biosynthesis C-methylase UbiE